MPYVSLPSKALTALNLPEVYGVTAKFTYNYFSIDECVPGSATTFNQNGVDLSYIFIPPTTLAGSTFFDAEIELAAARRDYHMPRFVTVNWAPADPLAGLSDTSEVQILEGAPPGVRIRDHLDRIIYAETMANSAYVGLSLQDTNVNTRFYTELFNTIDVSGFATDEGIKTLTLDSLIPGINDSEVDTTNRASALLDTLHSGQNIDSLVDYVMGAGGETTASDAKQMLYSIMTDYNARGISIYSEDDIIQAGNSLDEMNNLVQNMSLRSVLAGDMTEWSSQNTAGAYGDDLRKTGASGQSTVSVLKNVQSMARTSTAEDGSITTFDYGIAINSDFIVHVVDSDEDVLTTDASSGDVGTPSESGGSAATAADPIKLCVAGYIVDKRVAYAHEQLDPGINISKQSLVVELTGTPSTGTATPDSAAVTFLGDSGSAPVSNVIDGDIVYGATYTYRVRTVYYVELDAINKDLEGTDTFQRVGVLIATRGAAWTATAAIDAVPPPPPTNLNFLYDYVSQNLILNWEFPVTSQRDIKKFRVFRRRFDFDEFGGHIINNAYDKPFTLLREFNFNDTINPLDTSAISIIQSPCVAPSHLIETDPGNPTTRYIDGGFKKTSRHIYAVTSVDARGFSSNLSQQFEVSFDDRKNSLVIRLSLIHI